MTIGQDDHWSRRPLVKKTIQAEELRHLQPKQEVDNEAIAELNMDEENLQRRGTYWVSTEG